MTVVYISIIFYCAGFFDRVCGFQFERTVLKNIIKKPMVPSHKYSTGAILVPKWLKLLKNSVVPGSYEKNHIFGIR